MGKGEKERIVHLSTSTRKVLLRYLTPFRPESDATEAFLSENGRLLTYDGLKLIIQQLAQEANIPRLHLHLLRHTLAVEHLMNGGEPISLKRMLGHT